MGAGKSSMHQINFRGSMSAAKTEGRNFRDIQAKNGNSNNEQNTWCKCNTFPNERNDVPKSGLRNFSGAFNCETHMKGCERNITGRRLLGTYYKNFVNCPE